MKRSILPLRLLSVCFIFILLYGCTSQQGNDLLRYKVANHRWDETLGNHRAVLNIPAKATAAQVKIRWRRNDSHPENHAFIIVNADNGTRIAHIRRDKVTNEDCYLTFGPIPERGTYYFYYLPYTKSEGWGGFTGHYLVPESAPDPHWLAECEATPPVNASVEALEARTSMDSFYPMEVAATQGEWDAYWRAHPAAYFVFTEDRINPIKMKQRVPVHWLNSNKELAFEGKAQPNEYYTFQLGVVPVLGPLENIQLEYSHFYSGKDSLLNDSFTCFNLEGVNPYGEAFIKALHVPVHTVQPLWIGVDIPADQAPGWYKGVITLTANNAPSTVIPVTLHIKGDPIVNRGDNDTWRHSRLRWLNSSAGIDKNPTVGYTDVSCTGLTFHCLGRSVELNQQSGLPTRIKAWDQELLSRPISLTLRTREGMQVLNALPRISNQRRGSVDWEWKARNDLFSVCCNGTMEFDGWMHFSYRVAALQDVDVEDVQLTIAMPLNQAIYGMGMGLNGQTIPSHYVTTWDQVAIRNPKMNPFDSFWMGSARGGLHCELRGTSYSGPLLQAFQPPFPPSWYNGNKGTLSMQRTKEQAIATVSTGPFSLTQGGDKEFEWAMLVMPVKEVDIERQFTERYYQANVENPLPSEEDILDGVRMINIHHATRYNPFINYPFLASDRTIPVVESLHRDNMKVKLFYTVRELSYMATELWAFRSLGFEVLQDGVAGGYPWLQEHLVTQYTPQWYHYLSDWISQDGIPADASILTSVGASRLYNYYVEAVAWLVREYDIDGLYLDDVAFDREMMKRIRKVMESIKPGCSIDLHSNTGFSKGPAMQYAEYFPFVDKLWFGESFSYDTMTPEQWLIEASGIPFGLTADILQQGKNPWLAMQYGMALRLGWTTENVYCDPRPIWKIWDQVDIAHTQMVGFWEPQPAVQTSDSAVKATAYIGQGRTLISLGNYSDSPKTVLVYPDWEQLGLDAKTATWSQPMVAHFQGESVLSAAHAVVIPPRQGRLIIIAAPEE